MDRKEAIEYWEEFLEEIPEIEGMPQEEKDKQEQATLMAIAALQQPQVGGWIPVTYHIPTREDGDEVLYAYILDCPIPEEGQEILVSFNGIVDMDVCCYDEGWYLDNRGDWTDVDAWMPLPEPYKESEEE